MFSGNGQLTDAGDDNTLTLGSGGISVIGQGDIYSDLVLSTNTSITLGGANRLSLRETSSISGTGQLTMTGSNIVYLDGGANTYSGGTVISGGAMVRVKNGDALGTGDVTFDGGTFAGNGANALLHENVTINAGGATLFSGGGYTSLGGTVSGAGTLTVTNGSGQNVFIDQDNSATFTGDVHINGASAIVSTKRNGISLDSGTANLILEDGGTLQGNGDHIDLSGRNIQLNGTGGTIKQAGGRNIFNFTGVISGAGELTYDNAGTGGRIQLDGTANTYTGGTRFVDGAIVWAKSNDSLGDAAGSLTFDGGTLQNSNSNLVLGSRDINLEAGGGTLQAGWNNRRIEHTGMISGAGKLTIANDSSAVRLAGANNYSGGTEILGTLWSQTGTLGTGDVVLNNSNVERGHLKNWSGATSHSNNIEIGADGGTLSAGWSSDLTLNGVVSGSGTMRIEGDSGTVVLANSSNTFSGDINLLDANSHLKFTSLGNGSYDGVISGDGFLEYAGSGTLLVDGVHSGTGLVIVEMGAAIGGDGALAGDLNIEAGGQFVFDELSTLFVAGLVSVDSTFGVDDLLNLSSSTALGTYTLIDNGSDFTAIENFGIGNAYSLGGGKLAFFQEGSLQLVVMSVPEPTTFSMFGLGIFGLLARRRRC